MKTCPVCNKEKALEDFSRDRGRPSGRTSACRPCYNARKALQRVAKGPRTDQRAANLQAKYGLTVEKFDAMAEAQGHRCACCGTPEPGGRHGQWHIDHDHACCPGDRSCGRCVRGLLCGSCNLGLGHFNDDVQRLRDAITYLTSKEPLA